MYPFEMRRKRKQTLQNQASEPQFLLLGSEPIAKDYLPGTHLTFHYRSHYLAKRRVLRTIRRLKQG